MDSQTPTRRRRHGVEERARLVALYQSSGLTLPEFAQQQGLKPGTFQQWLYQANGRKRSLKPRFQEVSTASLLSPSWACEVVLPSGLVLRLSSSASPTWIGSVLNLLRSPSC